MVILGRKFRSALWQKTWFEWHRSSLRPLLLVQVRFTIRRDLPVLKAKKVCFISERFKGIFDGKSKSRRAFSGLLLDVTEINLTITKYVDNCTSIIQ